MVTREERFLLAIYNKIIEEKPDNDIIDAYSLGRELHFSEKQTKQVIHALAHGNFIKKYSSSDITITANGLALVRLLKT